MLQRRGQARCQGRNLEGGNSFRAHTSLTHTVSKPACRCCCSSPLFASLFPLKSQAKHFIKQSFHLLVSLLLLFLLCCTHAHVTVALLSLLYHSRSPTPPQPSLNPASLPLPILPFLPIPYPLTMMRRSIRQLVYPIHHLQLLLPHQPLQNPFNLS